MTCPLCNCEKAAFYEKDKNRSFYLCPECKLVFDDPNGHISLEDEKERYDKHNNTNDNTGYVKYLQNIIDTFQPSIKTAKVGLDFGSGPTPVMADLLQNQGYVMEIFDVFYANRPDVWQKQFDFIIMCEVIEHLHHPNEELARLEKAIREDGYLVIVTNLYDNVVNFKDWWYKNDATHVCFYSKHTIDWMANNWQLKPIHQSKNVIVLHKTRS